MGLVFCGIPSSAHGMSGSMEPDLKNPALVFILALVMLIENLTILLWSCLLHGGKMPHRRLLLGGKLEICTKITGRKEKAMKISTPSQWLCSGLYSWKDVVWNLGMSKQLIIYAFEVENVLHS